MMLFNLNRAATCVAIVLFLLLAIPSVSRSQEPAAQSETIVAKAADESTTQTLDPETKESKSAVVNTTGQQIDSPAEPKTSTPTVSVQTPAKKQATDDDSGWHFGLTPYLFLPSLSGKVGARGHTIELGSSNFSGTGNRDNFVIGFMAAVEARKGRFVIVNDMIWSNITSEKDTVGPLYGSAKVGTKLFVIDPEVGYRFVNSEKGSVDVLAGVRVWSVEANLDTTTGALPGFSVSQRKTWAAPVIGIRGTTNITPRFFLSGKFDIGGAGIGADLTTQLIGIAGFKFTKHVAMLGGYRWLQVDYDDKHGFLFDTQMSGIVAGLKFSW
ncbi:MAG: hypothetical protein DMF63_13305 [Acidobacteria bacterium]|nr:MAG: hypothetical protein DMF63_13305 [Acidobacteriota bacterium]